MIRSYQELVKRVPLLKDLSEQGDIESLELLYKNVRPLSCHCSHPFNTSFWQLRKGADMARGDDTSHLKAAVVEWVVDMFGVSDPPLQARSKDERGFANEHTGRLLCPSKYSWDDPAWVFLSFSPYSYYSLVNSWNRECAGIHDGHADYIVTASSWPMFLYANLTCDQDDLEKGLFKGSMLVKASIPTSCIDALLSADMITGLQINIYVSILRYWA
jgi:hypothetical protein